LLFPVFLRWSFPDVPLFHRQFGFPGNRDSFVALFYIAKDFALNKTSLLDTKKVSSRSTPLSIFVWMSLLRSSVFIPRVFQPCLDWLRPHVVPQLWKLVMLSVWTVLNGTCAAKLNIDVSAVHKGK
jgi:hypothetical protein